MSREFENKLQARFTITERATLRMAESVMSNYRDAQLALLDLVDNAVDNRTPGQQLTIKVNATRDSITIFNQGGEGLDLEGLENFLNWGHSEKAAGQIGQYGVGGKAAMGFLGQSIEVRCSPNGSTTEYRLSDPDWGSKIEEAEKEHQGEARRTDIREGYFWVRISNLKHRVEAGSIAAKLGDTYRPLLKDGSVKIMVNNKEVQPLEISYLDSNPNFKPERVGVTSGFGPEIDLTVGVLENGQKLDPGIRCYYRGRLISKGQFFGHKTPGEMLQASRLIGEAHLDHLGVTTNKSDFIRDIRWEDASAVLNRALAPWMEKLEDLKIEQANPVEKYEKELLNEAKRIFEHILANTGLLTKAQLPGESGGRLPPTRTGEPSDPPSGTSRAGGTKKGATAPDIRADVGETIKRWGPFFKWDSVPMGNDNIRWEVIDEKGQESLRINVDYPMYQAKKRAGNTALQLYQLETAIMASGREVFKDSSIDEYLEWVNETTKHVGTFYYHRLIREAPSRASNRGASSR